MVMRTYTAILEARGDKRVTRELPADPQDAREMAVDLARRNDAWKHSRWQANNGDAFNVGPDGELVELTIDEMI